MPSAHGSGEDLTRDALFGGRLRFWQPRHGHRFGLDSVLLAAHASRDAADLEVLDAAAGVGVVGLCLAWLTRARGRPRSVTAIELQAPLAALASRNAAANADACGVRVDVVHGDLRQPPFRTEAFDLIACNPPYRRPGTGRIASDPSRALGRHELALPLPALLDATCRLLKPTGRACLSSLAEREGELRRAAASAGLSVSETRPILARPGARPKLVLLGLVRSDPSVVEGAPRPLVVHDDGDGYQPEVEDLLERGVPDVAW